MKAQENEKWVNRIGKLDVILSIVAGLIEIGLFLSYIKDAVTIETAIISGLVVAAAFCVQSYIRNRKILRSYKAEQYLSKYFPAIVAFLKAMQSLPKEFRADEQILYNVMTVTCEIDGSNATYTRRTIGQNVSNKDIERMVYRVCGETSIENGRVQPKVFRNLEGHEKEKLEPVVLWSTSNVKVIGVDLNPAIKPITGKIDITFSAKWLGAFVSKYGYVFVSLFNYVRGVERLVVNVRFKEKVSRCSVWTWDMKKHELKELERLKNPKPDNDKYTIRWQQARPETSKIYIFRFRRSSI